MAVGVAIGVPLEADAALVGFVGDAPAGPQAFTSLDAGIRGRGISADVWLPSGATAFAVLSLSQRTEA